MEEGTGTATLALRCACGWEVRGTEDEVVEAARDVVALMGTAPLATRAEVSELRIPLGAGGFGFLPLNMMQKHNLIEKYAAEAGTQGVALDVGVSAATGQRIQKTKTIQGSLDPLLLRAGGGGR